MISVPPNMIAVEPIFDADMSTGGIIIPDEAKERCDQGIIKYIGDGVHAYLSIGDYILFSGYSGTLVELEGEGKLLIMHQKAVLAKIEGDDYTATIIPGVYYKTRDLGKVNEYIPATVESIFKLVTDQITHNTSIRFPLRPRLNKSDFRPKIEDMQTQSDWSKDDDSDD